MNIKKSVSSQIESRILLMRGQKVMIDTDLAELYGVPTKRLNEQVKRNRERFPDDFVWQLSSTEKQQVVANCDHLARLKFSKSLPFVFTEHGAMQAANVLGSAQAIEVGVYVVRTFVRLRELVTTNKELALRLADLESRTELLSYKQNALEHSTRAEFLKIFAAIRALMAPQETTKRPIGFVNTDNLSGKL